MPEAKIFLASDLRIGLKASYERDVSEEDVLLFAQLSGDHNPLHVDLDYAGGSNYQGRIAHGAFQVGLASALLGMHLPGRNVLLTSINSRFPSPLYFPSRVRVTGEIVSWNQETRGGQLKVLVQEVASLKPTAEVFMGFTLHESRPDGPGKKTGARSDRGDVSFSAQTSKIIIVTGASGGLGTAIVTALAQDYDILAITNRQPLAGEMRDLSGMKEVSLDLAAPDMEEGLLALTEGLNIYGVVHAAWPGAPRGGLLQADGETLTSQLNFGTVTTIRLARVLSERVGSEGGRLIALGSTAGSFKPYLPMAVYSLGKACLESTVKLLAPELARKNITVNAACPSFVPVGINKQASQRQILMESAAIPMGRLCQTEDVTGMIHYLLSKEAGFISGQVLELTGAQI